MAARRCAAQALLAVAQRAAAASEPAAARGLSALSSSLLSLPSTASHGASAAAVRSLWTSRPSLTSFSGLLKDEIAHERKQYQKPEAIAAGPPAPFTLTEVPDDTLLTLSRTYKDEAIAVNLQVGP